eukprot:c11508_g2_i1.p1 GENE.c11508_g2_i1~~c11508_g2_i1.p1  ORF type:complete len:675 (-),score=178.75 c11508_g2_i1:33-2057(-)
METQNTQELKQHNHHPIISFLHTAIDWILSRLLHQHLTPSQKQLREFDFDQTQQQSIVRHGLLTHFVTSWHILVTFLLRRRVLGAVSMVFVLVFVMRQSFTLRGTIVGIIDAWASIGQSIIAFTLLMSQRIAKYRTKHGKFFAARVLLVPAFETLLWVVFGLTMCDLCLMTEGNETQFPHFIEVFYNPRKDYETSDFILFFLHTFIKNFTTTWFVYFLFLEYSLSRSAIVRACSNATHVSLATSLIVLFGYIFQVVFDEASVQVVCNCAARGSAVAAYAVLVRKTYRSSRKSVLPFAVMSCILCFLDIIISLSLLKYLQAQPLRHTTNSLFSIFYSVFFNITLYWTLFLDTAYWRAKTRMPIWCVNSDISPYDQVPDAVIERDMPLLIDRPSLLFIDFAFLQFGEAIAAGSTSRVYRGKILIGPHRNKDVAIKVFTPIEISSETLSEFANEIHKYERLRHVRVMQLVGVCVRPPDVCMVCELCESSLHTHIHSLPLNVHTKMKLSVQVCEAVMFIHTLCPPLIHRDIKSHNFLITSTGDCKLSDFGTSKEFHEHSSTATTRERAMTKMIGSLHWMSPEVLSGSDHYDLKADIFSLGIVIWEIWAQEDPYQHIVEKRVIASQIISGLRPNSAYLCCPPQVRTLIESMWHHDPTQRPSALEAFETIKELEKQFHIV